ncbi:MAG: hypothetical protein ACYC24_09785 [Desulfobacteria bacterium]
MRKIWILGLVGVFALVLAGCGGGSSGPDPFVFEQLSDQTVDSYIAYTGVGSPSIFPASSTNTIQVGVDAGGAEYRGFLDFPIGGIPSWADVRFAYVEVFVGSVPFGADVPVLVELVDFQPPVLIESDFFRSPPDPYLAPILGRSLFYFFPSDASSPRNVVRIEVTSLVQRALQRLQPDFQVRLLLDPDPSAVTPAIVTLDDGAANTAPLLHVEYF